MSKPLSAAAVATLALSAMAEDMSHKGRLWDDQRYAQGCTPGEPGHARPSVSRHKKAKTHGKNKKKRRK
ncbi:putative uncharacterised protein [Salmonella phage Vi01]|uniref:Uncharacterized protein n=1 Tax=Salmonella phage ViI TaxID=1987993 RepID=E1XTL5_BPSAV|nr:putative uncharacterised protein [Salmonella phage Vi01]YP_009966782.1 hypothetical protein HYQ27_gp060 [Salmonella phage Se-J]QPX73934.1 hypothetical protein [Salmonella phage AR2819]CBW38074.1 putative uncharacterised protein [Salmonella phage Vi01]